MILENHTNSADPTVSRDIAESPCNAEHKNSPTSGKGTSFFSFCPRGSTDSMSFIDFGDRLKIESIINGRRLCKYVTENFHKRRKNPLKNNTSDVCDNKLLVIRKLAVRKLIPDVIRLYT